MATASPSPFGQPVEEKLGRNNFLLWKTQVLPAVRGAQMMGYLDGTTAPPARLIDVKEGEKVVKATNLEYTKWVVADQQVLSYLLSSLMREILTLVVSIETAAELWRTLENMLCSQTENYYKMNSFSDEMAMTTTRKGNMKITDYINKMKSFSDEMAVAGKPMDDEEIVAYILAGLDEEYDPVVSVITGRTEAVTIADTYTQLLSFEDRLSRRAAQHSANAASRGRGGNQQGRGSGGRGRGGGNRGRGGRPPSNGGGRGNRPTC